MAHLEAIDEFIEELPFVSKEVNYWLVRTSGGDFYDDFIKGNYIAIGYDRINLLDVKTSFSEDKLKFIGSLSNIIKSRYKDSEKRPGFSASQIIKFVTEIKKGDIVLIPDQNSNNIYYGEVSETATYLQEGPEFEGDQCPYRKRKRVSWIKSQPRWKMEPSLYKLLFSHTAITAANSYSDQINQVLYSFYIKEDVAHLILNVKAENHVKANDLFHMGGLTLALFDEFCEEEELPFNSSNFNVKLNVQSPGFIDLSGVDVSGIILLGVIIVGIVGGGFEVQWGRHGKAKLKTEGLIEKVKSFLDRKSKTKKAKSTMVDLQVDAPDEIKKLIGKKKKKN